MSGYEGFGPVAGIVGLVVGFGSNFLNAIRVGKRLLLHNGYHRAVGLRLRGATHAPCVFRDVADHQAVGLKPGGTFDPTTMESADPPTVAHFTQGRAYDVQLKAYSRTLHVSWAEYVTTYE